MNHIQKLIDERRELEAKAAGKTIEICMALGLREEAQEAEKQMKAVTVARQAAREYGCYFDQQGEIDRARMVA